MNANSWKVYKCERVELIKGFLCGDQKVISYTQAVKGTSYMKPSYAFVCVQL